MQRQPQMFYYVISWAFPNWFPPEPIPDYSRSYHRHSQDGRRGSMGNPSPDHDMNAPPVIPEYPTHVPHKRHHVERPVRPILFYDRNQPYYEFTNFAPYAIHFRGETYPTAEHLFQALKFMEAHPHLAERIRQQPSSRAALQEATRLRRLQRQDWFEVNLEAMDTVLELKFTQHAHLRQMLVRTGNQELIEDSPVDSFWGIGQDRQGRNELGKALMRLRAKLTQGS